MAGLGRRNTTEVFLPPMLETHLFGDFLRHTLSKFTENVTKPEKKPQQIQPRLCLWKQQTKRFQEVFPYTLKTLGCILCGMGGSDGGCIELGVKVEFNELAFPVFHTALSPRGVHWPLHSGITQDIAGQG